MYRILVADDEALIREGIKYLLDYEALGFTICSEAADGIQACAQMLAINPDVVLMDIRMPGMTGLEAAGKARREGFSGKIIIVSSYTDFSYAQEAMRQGVQNYITKPIDEEELESILRQFKEELDQQAQASSISQHYRSKARYSIIRDVLQGEADLKQFNLQDLHLNTNTFQVLICEQYTPSSPDPKPLFEAMLHLPNPDYCAYDQVTLHGCVIYLLKGSAVNRLEERLAAAPNVPEELYMALGPKVTSVEEISRSYQIAAQLHSRRFFSTENKHLADSTDLDACRQLVPFINNLNLQRYADILLDCIRSFNHKMLQRTIEELHGQLLHCNDSVDTVKLFLTALYLQIKNQMSSLYPNDADVFSSNDEYIQALEQCCYLHQIIALLRQELEAIASAIGTTNRDSVLDEILHYIHHNYTGNITLEDISQLFGYNRSYLGKIFSKKMGQNFNTYLDQVRIERAKELLLQEDGKIYSIAARVGYRNVDYFHIKFKKYVGMSPAEYRRAHKETSCSPMGNTEKGSLF